MINKGQLKKCPKANRDESREGKRLCLFCNKDKNTYFQAKKGITIRPADKVLRTKSWTGRKEGIMYTREQKEKALAMYGRGHSPAGISVETGVVHMDSKSR